MKNEFSVSVLGPSGEGKSSYITYLTKKTTLKTHKPTTEVTEIDFKFSFHDKPCSIKIFDTPGEKEYESLLNEPISKSDGFIIVFSKEVDKKTQQQKILQFLKKITKKDEKKNPTVFLLASMDDLDSLKMSFEDVEDLALQFGAKAFEISSKTGNQVEQSFEAFIKKLHKRKEKGPKPMSQRLIYALELNEEDTNEEQQFTKNNSQSQIRIFDENKTEIPQVQNIEKQIEKTEKRKSTKLIDAFSKKKEEPVVKDEVNYEEKRKSLQKNLMEIYSDNELNLKSTSKQIQPVKVEKEKRKSLTQTITMMLEKRKSREIEMDITTFIKSETDPKIPVVPVKEKRKSLSGKITSIFKK
eukprot:gene1437-12056_t